MDSKSHGYTSKSNSSLNHEEILKAFEDLLLRDDMGIVYLVHFDKSKLSYEIVELGA